MKNADWKRTQIDPSTVVEIAGNGAIAGPYAHGVFVPVLILDTTLHPGVAEAIRQQAMAPAGDVLVQWGKIDGEIALALRFVRPVSTTAVIKFEFDHHAILVDLILSARLVYLQSGKPGDRIKHDVDKTKMVVQVDESGFDAEWEEYYLSRQTSRFRLAGMKQRLARIAARETLVELRKFGSVRLLNDKNIPTIADPSGQDEKTS
jgi:hypothetical protein